METVISAPSPAFHASGIVLQTEGARQFIDITDQVAARVARAGIRNGLAVVSSQHTTAAIVVNEHEPELHKDLDRMLREIAPEDRSYAHNEVPCLPGERPNAHSHCQALLLGASATLAVADGRPVLGRWQRIFLVELDSARRRTVVVSVLGS